MPVNRISPARLAHKALETSLIQAQEAHAGCKGEPDHLLTSLAIVLRVINSARNIVHWRVAIRAFAKRVGLDNHRRTAPEILLVVKLFFPNHNSDDHFLYTGFIAYACQQGWASTNLKEKFTATKMTITEAAKVGRKAALAKGWPPVGIVNEPTRESRTRS